MNDQEIKDYFGPNVIYTWAGTADELQQFMEAAQNSYNFLRTRDVIYFVATKPVSGPPATVWFDNTQAGE